MIFLVAFQSDYELLWAIPQDQQQQAAAANFESAPLPVYSDESSVPQPPPPPYTTHASIGEISVHRSYHNEASLDHGAAMLFDGSQLQHLTQVETVHEHDNVVSHDVLSALTYENEVQSQNIYHPAAFDDPQQVTEQATLPPPLSWLPASLPPHEQFNGQSELPTAVTNYPLATSTPTSSLSELNTVPNNTTDIFIRNGLLPAPPAMSLSPPKTSTPTSELPGNTTNVFVNGLPPAPAPAKKCGVPLLRPIRPKNLSAPNLFVSYPSPPPSDNDILNNTVPRISRLPPLRRKTAPNLPEIPQYLFNEDQGSKLRPLPRSVSACETIREVTSCETSTESANNS